MAANRLTQREDVTVTLINPRSTFIERIRLHQLVGVTVGYDYLAYAAGSVAAPTRACPERLSSPTPLPAWRRQSGCGRSSTPRLLRPP